MVGAAYRNGEGKLNLWEKLNAVEAMDLTEVEKQLLIMALMVQHPKEITELLEETATQIRAMFAPFFVNNEH